MVAVARNHQLGTTSTGVQYAMTSTTTTEIAHRSAVCTQRNHGGTVLAARIHEVAVMDKMGYQIKSELRDFPEKAPHKRKVWNGGTSLHIVGVQMGHFAQSVVPFGYHLSCALWQQIHDFAHDVDSTSRLSSVILVSTCYHLNNWYCGDIQWWLQDCCGRLSVETKNPCVRWDLVWEFCFCQYPFITDMIFQSSSAWKEGGRVTTLV